MLAQKVYAAKYALGVWADPTAGLMIGCVSCSRAEEKLQPSAPLWRFSLSLSLRSFNVDYSKEPLILTAAWVTCSELL